MRTAYDKTKVHKLKFMDYDNNIQIHFYDDQILFMDRHGKKIYAGNDWITLIIVLYEGVLLFCIAYEHCTQSTNLKNVDWFFFD